MASPQKENGHTEIANELLEQIYGRKFSVSQFKILLIVIRYTYGFSRKQATLSNTFISNGTGIHEKNVSKEINSLIKDRVLIQIKAPAFNQSRIISLNKNYEEWNGHEVVTSLPVSEVMGVSEVTTKGVSEVTTEGLVKPLTKKENIRNKNIRNKDMVIDAFFEDLWKEYPRKRGKSAVSKNSKEELMKAGADVIKSAINKYKKEIEEKNTEEQFIMHGSTFFNGRWRDFIVEEQSTPTQEINTNEWESF